MRAAWCSSAMRLPGEVVRAVVTDLSARFLRADAVEVLKAAPGRVDPPCPHAGPSRCGGCDWQHADLDTQRQLKAPVVARAAPAACRDRTATSWSRRSPARRTASAGGPGSASPWSRSPDGSDCVGTGRTRSRCSRPARSRIRRSWPRASSRETWPNVAEVSVAVGSTGDPVVAVDGQPVDVQRVHEEAVGRTWRVTGDGFWQVHPGAAETPAAAVLDGARLRGRGSTPWTSTPASACSPGPSPAPLGPGGRVDAVEGAEVGCEGCPPQPARPPDRPAAPRPRRGLAVRRHGAQGRPRRARPAAYGGPSHGRSHGWWLCSRGPIAYVACDPASLRSRRTDLP